MCAFINLKGFHLKFMISREKCLNPLAGVTHSFGIPMEWRLEMNKLMEISQILHLLIVNQNIRFLMSSTHFT